MKLYKPVFIKSILFPTLLLVSAWLVAGCSGSSDSVENEGQPSINLMASEVNNDNSNGSSSENIDEVETEPDTEITSAEMMLEDGVDESVNISPVVTDPLIQNTIPVTFEINVPFYLSNELQVKLIWGEINLTAMWVVNFGQSLANSQLKLNNCLRLLFMIKTALLNWPGTVRSIESVQMFPKLFEFQRTSSTLINLTVMEVG